MKKVLLPVFFALVIGFIYGRFMLNQYGDKEKLVSVFNTTNKVYFMQIGAYSSIENMENTLNNIPYYIYSELDGMYYVYIGITGSKENSLKLKGYFKNIGYDIYVKEFNINNKKFKDTLDKFDVLLSGTDDNKTIEAIEKQIIEKYKELVLTE